jgi:hypothetical protein
MRARIVRGSLLREIVGWYGVAALLVAYALVSFDVVKAESPTFQMLNLTGAAGIAVLSLAKRAYQPAVLNAIWGAIALAALVGLLV